MMMKGILTGFRGTTATFCSRLQGSKRSFFSARILSFSSYYSSSLLASSSSSLVGPVSAFLPPNPTNGMKAEEDGEEERHGATRAPSKESETCFGNRAGLEPRALAGACRGHDGSKLAAC
ncbi:unnamed protein product [Prorocentrum cordatum]|uniref:Uncharacterized protein n=1 Tax=Prorocentrum cordatum TaxID=2364126 RepID=A0ABN9SZ15_9DINO|nr:unnamed protein product [Polarella glacialis]